jgi:hypothetical protein
MVEVAHQSGDATTCWLLHRVRMSNLIQQPIAANALNDLSASRRTRFGLQLRPALCGARQVAAHWRILSSISPWPPTPPLQHVWRVGVFDLVSDPQPPRETWCIYPATHPVDSGSHDHQLVIAKRSNCRGLCYTLTAWPLGNFEMKQYAKIPFIDIFYHQSSERHPGHTARAPPLSRGGKVRTGDQTTASPMP